eukprot:Phypoly_transcript_16453.p1 GENE.Phypoly_transcript_16453~~Phypoly_transcript_16453.p1  ORF type:complete len:219 (+),score=30.30 Phypoly_transcript_16453:199-855(+)
MRPALHANAVSNARKNLKPTETLVTTHEGTQYRETKVDGKVVRVEVNDNAGNGFVVDTKPDVDLYPVKNMKGLFIGSQDAAANMNGLTEHKITHILNVATGIKNLYEGDFKYKSVELLDVDETNILRAFPQCFDFISEALYGGGSVLVHCNAGVSRSAAVVIGYLMENYTTEKGDMGISYLEAIQILKESRPAIQPNRGFVKQLERFDKDRGLLYEQL